MSMTGLGGPRKDIHGLFLEAFINLPTPKSLIGNLITHGPTLELRVRAGYGFPWQASVGHHVYRVEMSQ